MQEPQRPDRSPRSPAESPENRPTTSSDVAPVPPRPSAPPTGAIPVIPTPPARPASPPHPPTGAQRVARVPQRPLDAAPTTKPDSQRIPRPSTSAPAQPAPAQSAQAGPAEHTPPKPAGPPPVEDTSPAAIIRLAVMGVPGVLGVGEPVSRALGRLAQAIGQESSAGVSVTQGDAELAVDLGIVASASYPLRDTAARVQQAVATALADAGRTLAEVNVEVLEVAAEEKTPGPATVPAPLAGAGQAASGSIPGHVRVGSRALSSTAQHLAARAFAVPVARVGISLRDDAGDLALRLNLPLPVRPLSAVAPPVAGMDGEEREPGEASIRERALGLRAPLRRDFEAVTGARLSRVDVQVTGVIIAEPDAKPQTASTQHTPTSQESTA